MASRRCESCFKTYSHRQSLFKHKKKCEGASTLVLNNKLTKQNRQQCKMIDGERKSDEIMREIMEIVRARNHKQRCKRMQDGRKTGSGTSNETFEKILQSPDQDSKQEEKFNPRTKEDIEKILQKVLQSLDEKSEVKDQKEKKIEDSED